jgi:type II secretory pathway pseudopilin PulG
LIELIIAITIIIILAALVLGTSGYVQKKSKRSRAEAEIAALSAALESYKADNGTYPANAATNSADATAASATPPAAASLHLYQALSGNDPNGGANQKSYFAFKPQMLGGQRTSGSNPTTVTFLRDPFGNSYGYSTARNPDTNPNAANASGYNPTFDLWSTADATEQSQWIKNW